MSKPTTAVMSMVVGVLVVFSVQAQEGDGSRLTPAERNGSGTLRELIPGYYVFSSTSFNSGVIAADDRVIVLDALTSEAIARKEREAIASRIKQPVRFLVSSTFHNNYTGGTLPIPTSLESATKITEPIYSLKCSEIEHRQTNKRPDFRRSLTAIA